MQTSGPLSTIQFGDITVIVFGEELKQIDEVNVSDVGGRLIEFADKLPHPLLILDMSATEFFGSTFIEFLFRVWKRLKEQPGARFGIAGLQPYCEEVLQITHLDTLWHLFKTREDAIAEFQKPAAN